MLYVYIYTHIYILLYIYKQAYIQMLPKHAFNLKPRLNAQCLNPQNQKISLSSVNLRPNFESTGHPLVAHTDTRRERLL